MAFMDSLAAHKLRDELITLGFVAHIEEVKNADAATASAYPDLFRVTTEPKRIDAAVLLRAVALQYEHYCYMHLELNCSLSFSTVAADA